MKTKNKKKVVKSKASKAPIINHAQIALDVLVMIAVNRSLSPNERTRAAAEILNRTDLSLRL